MNAQMMILLYAVLLFVVIYFMMVVPGKKKNKKMQELHDSIKVGDEVLTMGGIIATVKERDGEILTVEIDPEIHKLLDERTDRTWPTTWFVPQLFITEYTSLKAGLSHKRGTNQVVGHVRSVRSSSNL